MSCAQGLDGIFGMLSKKYLCASDLVHEIICRNYIPVRDDSIRVVLRLPCFRRDLPLSLPPQS